MNSALPKTVAQPAGTMRVSSNSGVLPIEFSRLHRGGARVAMSISTDGHTSPSHVDVRKPRGRANVTQRTGQGSGGLALRASSELATRYSHLKKGDPVESGG